MVKQLFAFLMLFAFTPLAFAEDYKVESIGALTEAKVAEAVRKAVEEKGLRVVDPKGKAVCEIWFRKDIPTGKDDVPGAIFSQIPEGTFIGVINFVGGWMGVGCTNAVLINTSTFRRGASFPKPTLWLYGEADPFYALSHSKGNFQAFVTAGGKGRFESYWVPGQSSGHAVIGYPKLWAEDVSKFLDSVTSPR